MSRHCFMKSPELIHFHSARLLWWLRGSSICLRCRRPEFDPWVRKIPWRRTWQPTPVLLPGESHGRRSLVGYSPRGHKESDTTERLHFHFQCQMQHLVEYQTVTVEGFIGNMRSAYSLLYRQRPRSSLFSRPSFS